MKPLKFTLIELLIVIAIILLLFSLLFPALVKARDRGKAICCLSNLKNIGLAVYSYADDWQGRFPRADQLTYGDTEYYPGTQYFDSWLAYLMVYTGGATDGDARKCASAPMGVWKCGALNTIGSGNYGYNGTNYAYQRALGSDRLTTAGIRSRPQDWRTPSQILVFVDGKDLGNGTNSTGFAGDDDGRTKCVGAAHFNQFNGLFIDGHACATAFGFDAKVPGVLRVPADMCVYAYQNPSYALFRLGHTLPGIW